MPTEAELTICETTIMCRLAAVPGDGVRDSELRNLGVYRLGPVLHTLEHAGLVEVDVPAAQYHRPEDPTPVGDRGSNHWRLTAAGMKVLEALRGAG